MDSAAEVYRATAHQVARDDLIVEHLPLVKQVLGRTLAALPNSADKENLEAAGTLGLVEAAWKYDPSRNVKFSTFARKRIYGAVMDELRRNCPLPQTVLERWGRVRAVLERNNGVIAISEIADQLGITEEEVEDCIVAIRLTQPESWTEASGLSANFDQLERAEEAALLADCIMMLSERDRAIVTMYYHDRMFLREIGNTLGLSESRVSRLLATAEIRLQKLVQAKYGD